MRATLDDHQLHVADQAGQPFAGLGVGRDLVVIALMTSIGTSILGRSARKSVSHVGMQATAAVAEADAAMFQCSRNGGIGDTSTPRAIRAEPTGRVCQKLR